MTYNFIFEGLFLNKKYISNAFYSRILGTGNHTIDGMIFDPIYEIATCYPMEVSVTLDLDQFEDTDAFIDFVKKVDCIFYIFQQTPRSSQA